MIGRNDFCWCGSGKKWKKCHFPHTGNDPQNTTTLPFSERAKLYAKKYGIILKTEEQIAGIRIACRITAEILDKLVEATKEGITTEELDILSRKLHREYNVIPAPLGYGEPPFPASICTSINEIVCHGIPEKRALKNGDIVNIDVSCISNGFFGDCSKMVIIGNTTAERKLVCDVSYESLMRSIAILKPGILVSQIGDVIQEYAEKRGTSVVEQFVGHGVGIHFHEAPQIPHYSNDLHIPLTAGMIFTIEPMINAGTYEVVIDPKDQWTTRTKDFKASAQWEHTILITETGHEILTPWK